MARLEHSNLLKFLKNTPSDIAMSDIKPDASGIESHVPEQQELRGDNPAAPNEAAVPHEDAVFSPVITVRKEESTFSKQGLKLQRIVVSEDISDESTTTLKMVKVTVTQNTVGQNTTDDEVFSLSTTADQDTDGNTDKETNEDMDQKQLKKTTKIPKLKLREAIEKIRKEKQMLRNTNETQSSGQRARSSIPRLKDHRKSQESQKNSIEATNYLETDSPKVDDEFDKIYEQIIESEISTDMPSIEKISDPVKLESKFEEIIHDYDENRVGPIHIEKPRSKIPLLKRKSEAEVEIPIQNNRKSSLKGSHPDDFKGKIPVAMTTVRTVKQQNYGETNSSKTSAHTIRTETVSRKQFESKQAKTSEKHNEIIELVTISSSENNNDLIVDDSDPKMNSATLNKLPVKLKGIEKLSTTQIGLDKEDLKADINVEETNLISSEVIKLGQVDNLVINNDHNTPTEAKVEPEITIQTTNSIEDNYRKPYFGNKSPQIEDDTNLSPKIDPIFNMPTIPSIVTKFERIENKQITSTGSISELYSLKISKETKTTPEIINLFDKNQVDSIGSPESLQNDTNVKERKFTIKSSNFIKDDKNNNKTQISETINSVVNDKEDDLITDDDLHKTDVKTKIPEETVPIDDVKYNKYSEISNIIHNQPKDIDDVTEKDETIHKTALTKIDPIIISKENDENKENELLSSKLIASIPSPNEIVSDEKNKPFKEEHKAEEPVSERESWDFNKPVKISNFEEVEEEDIIILKGKVNRVIKRLDSKDFKAVKKEVDDVPKEVSVLSKIAIFEKNEFAGPAVNPWCKRHSDKGLINNKPKIVDEILKIPPKSQNNEKEESYAEENNKLRSNGFKETRDGDEMENNRESRMKEEEKSSLEILTEYKRRKEDLDRRRAKSLAELDLGDAVEGRVKRMVVRMSSVDRVHSRRELIDLKEKPRPGSVSQRVALYEVRYSSEISFQPVPYQSPLRPD